MQLTSASRGELATDGGTLAGRVRRRFEALEADRERSFALPGYEGVLEVVYRRLPIDDVERVLSDPAIESMNERYAQFLIDACVGIYGLEEDGVTRSTLEDGRPLFWGEVVRMANPAASPDGARAEVLEIFDGNDHELRDHGDDVYRWTKRAHAAAQAAIAGGS